MSQGQHSPDRPPPAWRSAPGAPPAPARRLPAGGTGGPRLRKLFILLAVILGLCGAIAAWVFLLRTFDEPLFVALPITEYRGAGLPKNPYVEEDGAALRRHFPGSRGAFDFQERHQLAAVLRGLRQEKPPALVVFLSAHAVVRDGQVYLLPGDAVLDNPDTWLPLGAVLTSMRRCHTEHRLLILDVMRATVGPDAKAEDGVSRQVYSFLEKELGKQEEPPLFVLCACGPGEVALAAEPVKLSLFAYHLNEGLYGAAVGYARKRNDGFVSVRDLAAYAAHHVDAWARHNLHVRQRPVLLGAGPDFYLASRSRPQAPARPADLPRLKDLPR